MPLSTDRADLSGELLRVRFALVCSPDYGVVTTDEIEADRIDFACMIAKAMSERAAGAGALPDLLGLDAAKLALLASRFFPDWALPDVDVERQPSPTDQSALSTLIRWRGGASTPEADWLADIIARRAMGSRHLWEDLGLPSRATLTSLMERHFPRLIELNHQGMRWKKFFYRQICSDSAFSLCLAPSCDDCSERDDCFAPPSDG